VSFDDRRHNKTWQDAQPLLLTPFCSPSPPRRGTRMAYTLYSTEVPLVQVQYTLSSVPRKSMCSVIVLTVTRFQLNWLIEQGLMSHQTHYRSYRERCLQDIWRQLNEVSLLYKVSVRSCKCNSRWRREGVCHPGQTSVTTPPPQSDLQLIFLWLQRWH